MPKKAPFEITLGHGDRKQDISFWHSTPPPPPHPFQRGIWTALGKSEDGHEKIFPLGERDMQFAEAESSLRDNAKSPLSRGSQAGLQAFQIKPRQCGNHQESWKGPCRGKKRKPCIWVSICGWTGGLLLPESKEKAGTLSKLGREKFSTVTVELRSFNDRWFFLMEKTTYHKTSQTVTNLPWRQFHILQQFMVLCVCHREAIPFVECVTPLF